MFCCASLPSRMVVVQYPMLKRHTLSGHPQGNHQCMGEKGPTCTITCKEADEEWCESADPTIQSPCLPIQDYITAGAIVQEDLLQAQLIISVKQVPVNSYCPIKLM
uniref:Uncharacterized protein n=1 Tax=Ditylenchus dipsaci TaxID=166011 RepID=A0A915CPT4_9BILA